MDPTDLLLGRLLIEGERDMRISRPNLSQQRRQRIQRCQTQKTDCQMADFPTFGPARSKRRVLDTTHDSVCLFEIGTAGFRQIDVSCSSIEQFHAEFALQISNLMTERRLRDVQAACRSTKMQLLCHGNEVTEMS